jgi:hypothetical protein
LRVRNPLYDSQARLTIPAKPPSPTYDRPSRPDNDAQALTLNALGWVLADDDRAARFLALTGLTPDSLRSSLDKPSTLAGVLDFLCAHEPDLIAAAEALGVEPAVLAGARERLRT